jgi:PAS domain S-box-containing protein
MSAGRSGEVEAMRRAVQRLQALLARRGFSPPAEPALEPSAQLHALIELLERVLPAPEAEAEAEAAQAAGVTASLAAHAKLIQAAPTPIMLVDRQHRFALVNPAYAELRARPIDELVGASVREILGETAYAIVAPELDRAFAGHQVGYEQWFTYPGGQRYLQVCYFPCEVEGRVDVVGVILTDLTTQKQIADALVESELRFRATFEQAAVGIAHVLPDGRFLRLNQKFCQITGYSHEELLQRSFIDITHPDDLQKDLDEGARLARGEIDIYATEKRYIRKNGLVVWIDLTGSAVRTPGGEPGGEPGSKPGGEPGGKPGGEPGGKIDYYIIVIQDISRRRAAELERQRLFFEVQQKRAELQGLFRSIPDPLVVCDREGRIIRTNPAAVATFGWNPTGSHKQELIDRLHLRLADGLPIDIDELPVSRVLRGEETVAGERLRLRNALGHEQIVAVTATPLRREGEVVGVVTVWRDITEREHLLEIAVRDSQRRAAELDAIISSIADGVTIHALDGTVVRMNLEAQRILGYSMEEIHTLPRRRQQQLFVPARDAGAPDLGDGLLQRALDGEVIRGAIVPLTRRDGQKLWTSVAASPIRTERGELLGAVATITDITELQELQERMRIFLHTISHDLRSPLATMLLQLEVLEHPIQAQSLPERVQRRISVMAHTCRQMSLMLADLVDSTRLEGEQLQLRRESTALGAFLEQFLLRTEGVLDLSRIVTQVAPDLPRILVDPDRFERILWNLLTNALKYSTGLVTIRAAPAGTEVIVSIADQGPGIPPEELPQLFSRFVRARAHRAVEGIGLGLYIVKQLVEAHGGRIWAESEPDKGAVFSFTMPIG